MTDSTNVSDNRQIIPKLVQFAAQDSLKSVEKLLGDCDLVNKLEMLNESVIRHDNNGEKWFETSPLYEAAQHGNAQIVFKLVSEGADPSLKCSPLDGVTAKPIEASRNMLKCLKNTFMDILNGNHFVYDSDTWTDTDEIIAKLLKRSDGLRNSIKILKLVARKWKKSSFAGAM